MPFFTTTRRDFGFRRSTANSWDETVNRWFRWILDADGGDCSAGDVVMEAGRYGDPSVVISKQRGTAVWLGTGQSSKPSVV